MKGILTNAIAILALGGFALAPVQASAQDKRQQTKNEWRNLAYIAGGLGILGLLKGDNTLFFAGTAGALYAADRYEKDRKSQSERDRARAKIFSQSSFTRDGVRYVRKSKMKNGKRYYYFQRVK